MLCAEDCNTVGDCPDARVVTVQRKQTNDSGVMRAVCMHTRDG